MATRSKGVPLREGVGDHGLKKSAKPSVAERKDSPTDEEIEAQIIQDQYARPEESGPDEFPHLGNLSGAFVYRFMPHPDIATNPEYVYVPIPERTKVNGDESIAIQVAIAEWNYAWEADHLRYEVFGSKLPVRLRWLKRYQGTNICLVPDEGGTRYGAYAAVYHLLPRRTLERHGLPLLRRGLWPVTMHNIWVDRVLPADFVARLSAAFAEYIWPFISPGSSLNKFSENDSLRLLSHNLNFWLPIIDRVAQDRLRLFPRVKFENAKQARELQRARKHRPPGVQLDTPLKGGSVWIGEEEAAQAAQEIVEQADASANLRTIVDAIRSNRVEEDFSDQWSYAREDFERRLFRKRNKIKINFVELSDTIPVHGPESEVYANLFFEDFIALLEPKERRVVVCLRNGATKLGDIARKLGYANHSPVSKALARVRQKAKLYLSA